MYLAFIHFAYVSHLLSFWHFIILELYTIKLNAFLIGICQPVQKPGWTTEVWTTEVWTTEGWT